MSQITITLGPWILGHLWSLSIEDEEQFYMVWPSVLKRWYRRRTRVLLGTLLGGSAALFTIGDNLAIGCLLAIFARIAEIKRDDC